MTTGAQVRRTQASLLLREGDWATAGRTQRRWSRFLLIPQLSFSVLILIVAGLFLRSVRIASEVDPGFNTTHTAMAGIQLGLAGFDDPGFRRLSPETQGPVRLRGRDRVLGDHFLDSGRSSVWTIHYYGLVAIRRPGDSERESGARFFSDPPDSAITGAGVLAQ